MVGENVLRIEKGWMIGVDFYKHGQLSSSSNMLTEVLIKELI